MGKEVSTDKLLIIAILAIALSAFSIFLTIGELGITGRASTGSGYSNITVESTVAIAMVTSQINFTDSDIGESKTSDDSANIASGCTADFECGINITNDGSCAINISMQNTEDLFDGASYSTATHYLYNVTFGSNDSGQVTDASGQVMDCSTGGSQGLAYTAGCWKAMPALSASDVAICGLNHTATLDSVMVDINMTVPGDELPGVKSAMITFTASVYDHEF